MDALVAADALRVLPGRIIYIYVSDIGRTALLHVYYS